MGNNPLFTYEHGPRKITILGTAHISHASAEKVHKLLASGDFDAVAVELCAGRHRKLTQPDTLAELDLFDALKQGMGSMILANLALGAFQQRLAEQVSIEPGQELRIAIEEAERAGYPLILIDRDVGTTLKRIASNLPITKRLNILSAMIHHISSRRRISKEEIEHLKEGDILESAFAQFAERESELFTPLIDERDQYMASRLLQEATDTDHQHMLAIVGAGHFNGIRKYLQQFRDDVPETLAERLRQLAQMPPKPQWRTWLPWLVPLLIVIGFAIGFRRSPHIGIELIWNWIIINGGLAALGTLLAGAHPLTIAVAFVAAPITSLNPMIGAGMVAAVIELWLRKPTLWDFDTLRSHAARFSGWWKNRVLRTLLVFILASIGSAIGTYIAGFMIYDRLI